MIKIVVQKSITVTGPVFLPNTPDCDYKNGEELLTPEKIKQLEKSFKKYNIIDYEHQFTNPNKPYYLKQIGTPIKTWISTKEHKITNFNNQIVTIPSGSLWLKTKITDPNIIKAVQEHKLTAYSATTAEKQYADEIMQLINNNVSNKNNITSKIDEYSQYLSFKRTLIKDIKEPVLFTVTLTAIPCVGQAMFCNKCSTNTKEENKSFKYIREDKMDNKTFIEKLRELFNKYDAKEEASTEEEKPEETSTPEKEPSKPKEEETDDDVKEEKTSDDKTQCESKQDESKETSSDTKEDKTTSENTSENKSEEDQEKTSDETEDEEDKKKKSSSKSNVKPTTNKKEKTHITTKSKQITTQDGIGGTKPMQKQHESQVIYDIIKNNVSTKSLENIEISYKNTGLKPSFNNQALLSMIYNKNIRESFKASFTEENTNKAVLDTNLFATYVKKLILSDPILEDANYQTVYGEKANIYTIGLTGDVTQDGILPEHYYFDSDPAETNIDIDKNVLEPVPQRAKLVISDRQVRNNVYGQDLLSNALSLTQDAFNRGVSTARIFGDTTLTGKDKQYTRRDGLLKSAGQHLVSTTDFDVADGIINIFETMFYALPEEAQNEADYCFYVPTNVYRAYYNYFVNKVQDRVVDLVTARIPLYWENIPIKTSPTLNNKKARTDLDEGKASILLTNPKNTNFGVGRNLTIEPDRHADTSSNTYFYTMDTDAKYSIPDYAVVAKMTDAEYKALPKAH